MGTSAKVSFYFHILNECLVGEHEIQQNTSPQWLLYHLSDEFVIDTLQEPQHKHCLCLVVLSSQQIGG